MSEQSDRLIALIKPFGLSADEARIYLYLTISGSSSALKISRSLKMARTKVYRLLDKLAAKGLVAQVMGSRGLVFSAQTPKKLLQLIAEKEKELEVLKKTVPLLAEELNNLVQVSQISSEVRYYQGLEGLKQVTWNSLQAEKELLIFEILDMSAFLDYGFSEKVREEFVKRKIKVRELTNQRHLPAWTKVTELVKKYWRCRFFDPRLLAMKFELLIYNDVYAMYTFKGKEIFCLEVHHQDLADMQKQIFDFMWQQAKRMKVLNFEGEAKVV